MTPLTIVAVGAINHLEGIATTLPRAVTITALTLLVIWDFGKATLRMAGSPLGRTRRGEAH